MVPGQTVAGECGKPALCYWGMWEDNFGGGKGINVFIDVPGNNCFAGNASVSGATLSFVSLARQWDCLELASLDGSRTMWTAWS